MPRGYRLAGTIERGECVFATRIHGRGGQGVVTAAELLSVAAFNAGKYAQAFPNFGSERTGAPVVSYCRIDDYPIRIREPIITPDALVIQDATLVHQVDVLAGLPPTAFVVVNTTKTFDALGLGEFASTHDRARLRAVPGTEIALRHLGRPVANVVLLAGLAALTGIVDLQCVTEALTERFSGRLLAANVAAAAEAFHLVSAQTKEQANAAAN